MINAKRVAAIGVAIWGLSMLYWVCEKREPPKPEPMPITETEESPFIRTEMVTPTPAEETDHREISSFISVDAATAIETTISGGLCIQNETSYPIDPYTVPQQPDFRLPAGQAQILIIHTHSSEAYTPAGLDRYEASDNRRTQDREYNIIRVGEELKRCLEQYGLHVVHDCSVFDYPSYTGSYERSAAAIQSQLEQNPGIRIVIDMHRDALGADGAVYKTVAEERGSVASQIMLLVGTDDSGLEHPYWQSNLSLALYLQQAAVDAHPSLMRPVAVVQQRYNQHLSPGSLIMEVGSSGNTLQEALAAVRLFAESAGPALAALVEEPS